MHPLAKDVGKFVIDRAQNVYVAAARAVGAIDFPVPPNSNMRRTSSSRIAHYYQSGINTGLPIATACRLHGLTLEAGSTALDFGAGVGRQIRYFVKHHPGLKLYACDVEQSHIDWLSKAYPSIEAYQSDYLPPLKFATASLDLIYSVSIFSHISEEHARAWLAEFARVIKPGGLACITSLGMPAHRIRGSEATRGKALLDPGCFHTAYSSIADAKLRAGRHTLFRQTEMAASFDASYGQTYYAPDYIRKNWSSADWTVAGIAEGVIDDFQDLVVLKRA